MIRIHLDIAFTEEIAIFVALPEYKQFRDCIESNGGRLWVSRSIKEQGRSIEGFYPRSTGIYDPIFVAAVGKYGDNAAVYLSNLVAALFEGEESDHYQATQEVRRLLNVSERP